MSSRNCTVGSAAYGNARLIADLIPLPLHRAYPAVLEFMPAHPLWLSSLCASSHPRPPPFACPQSCPTPCAGGWWPAVITGYNEEMGEHQLTYNAGQEDESFEWVAVGEMSNEELRDAAASAPIPHLEDLPPLPPGLLTLPLPAGR